MASLPKPLIGLLLGTVAFFAVWMVALKPHSSSGGGSQGVGQYQPAIKQAHQAVATSNAANAKLGAPTSTVKAAPAKSAPAATTAPAAKAAATAPAAKATKTTPTGKATKTAAAAKATKPAQTPATANPAEQLKTVQSAVAAHKVVAVLFYNDAAADDQAMEKELAAVPTHGGEVVKLAVPVSELTQFAMITQQIPVVTAPTLVLIDPQRQATTMTGYASPLEISQRIDDALASK